MMHILQTVVVSQMGNPTSTLIHLTLINLTISLNRILIHPIEMVELSPTHKTFDNRFL